MVDTYILTEVCCVLIVREQTNASTLDRFT